MSTDPTAALRSRLAAVLDDVRQDTLALVAPLGDDDVHEQFVGFMSPVVWDVGHVGNFEELWLVRRLDGRPSSDPDLDRLYNPFENPRWVRGDLPLLPRDRALPYLHDVRDETLSILRRIPLDPAEPLLADGHVYRLLVQHETQHQETILQALGLREDLRYAAAVPAPVPATWRSVDDTDRVAIPGGDYVVGCDDRRWAYDNERPAHAIRLRPFVIDRFPLTTRRFAAFVAEGGYDRPEHWSEDGWRWRDETGHRWPQGWLPTADGGWSLRRFGAVEPLDPREPVQHVSWWEAEAFARWAGGRLPTEHEWEVAAAWDPTSRCARRFPWGDAPPDATRCNIALDRFGPTPVGSYPAGASPFGVEQTAGDVYEWTASRFDGYPGFEAFPYPEYSEVFFGGDYRVLRGSSWAIGAPFARATYRNWDHPYRRQLMAGLRLAWDV